MNKERMINVILFVSLVLITAIGLGACLQYISGAEQARASEAIIAEQAESIMALEQNVKLLRAEVVQLRKERDEAVGEIRALKSVIPTSRSADRPKLTLQEMRELAGTVHVEARGEPPEGKMMVAKVALNRLRWNPGKTLHQILTREGAFANGKDYESADMAAVFDALADDTPLYNSVGTFFNPKTATNTEFVNRKMKDAVLTIGNHVFCR